MRAHPLRRRAAGFALIEALVAFAILSIALATLLSGIAIGLRADRHATERRFAFRALQARLERLGMTDPLAPGQSEGLTEQGQKWRQTVTEVEAPRDLATGAPASSAWVGLWAEIVVTLEDGSDISLGALKLMPAQRRPRT